MFEPLGSKLQKPKKDTPTQEPATPVAYSLNFSHASAEIEKRKFGITHPVMPASI